MKLPNNWFLKGLLEMLIKSKLLVTVNRIWEYMVKLHHIFSVPPTLYEVQSELVSQIRNGHNICNVVDKREDVVD